MHVKEATKTVEKSSVSTGGAKPIEVSGIRRTKVWPEQGTKETSIFYRWSTADIENQLKYQNLVVKSQSKEQRQQHLTNQVFKIPPKKTVDMFQEDALRACRAAGLPK